MKQITTSLLVLAFLVTTPVAEASVYDEMRQTLTGIQSSLNRLQQPEARVLGISTNSDGYTEFTPSSDTRIIYVSASQGNDANDGLSEATPKRTIAAGRSLMRYGYPDWLLLRKGDTWNEELGRFDADAQSGAISGRSASEPALFSSYGTGPRPLLRVTNSPFTGLGKTYGADHLAIVGLEFYAHQRDPDSPTFNPSASPSMAMSLQRGFDSFLFEDNKVSFIQLNLQGRNGGIGRNARVRNNVFIGSYSTNGHAQCIYSWDQMELVVEYNSFQHCGWNDRVNGANSTIYNRTAYLAGNYGGIIYRGNVDALGASGGVQVRPGGTVEDNLFFDNPHSAIIGHHLNPNGVVVSGAIRDNVMLGSRNIDTQNNGSAIVLSSANPTSNGGVSELMDVSVNGNIMAHNRLGTSLIAAIKNTYKNDGTWTNVDIYDNIIYDWTHPTNPNSGTAVSLDVSSGASNSSFTDNIIQQPRGGGLYDGNSSQLTTSGNRYWSASGGSGPGGQNEQVNFVDPDRDVDSYMDHIGIGGGKQEFLRRLTLQSKDTYDERFTAEAVNNYIRDGFQITGNSTPAPDPQPEEETDSDNDGIPDASDNCPNSSNATQADNDNDGMGNVCDTDDDNDWIPDTAENSGCSFNPDPQCGVATPGPGDEGTSNSIVNAAHISNTSNNFANNHEPANLFDGSVSRETGYSTGGNASEQFWVEFDLGQLYDLTTARLYGDIGGNWRSHQWTVQTKLNQNDAYSTAFANRNVSGNQWFDESMDVTARYVRLTVTGTPDSGSVQAMEFELRGTLTTESAGGEEKTIDEESNTGSETADDTPDTDTSENGGGSNNNAGSDRSGNSGGGGGSSSANNNSADNSDQDITQNRVRTTANLNVRTTPGGTLVRMVALGTVGSKLDEAPIQKDGRSWVKVRFDNGTEGYVAESFIRVEADTNNGTSRIRTTANLNVRTTPGGALITQVSPGTRGIQLTAAPVEQGEYRWHKVRFDNGTEGYVASNYLAADYATGSSLSDAERQAKIAALRAQLVTLLQLLLELQRR